MTLLFIQAIIILIEDLIGKCYTHMSDIMAKVTKIINKLYESSGTN